MSSQQDITERARRLTEQLISGKSVSEALEENKANDKDRVTKLMETLSNEDGRILSMLGQELVIKYSDTEDQLPDT